MGILKKIREVDTGYIQESCKKNGIELLLLFGSVAREKEHRSSDIDFAYRSKKRLEFSREMEFKNSLKTIFDLKDYSVDLVYIKEADPLLLKKISEDAFLIFGSEKDFYEFKRIAFHKYSDYKPYLQREKIETAKLIERLKSA
ncbi:MAG: type VII toxin-antitoxin system MntA family adenylyltransferase antitoxin [bacterium]